MSNGLSVVETERIDVRDLSQNLSNPDQQTRIMVCPGTSRPAISADQFAPSSLNRDIVNYGLWLGLEAYVEDGLEQITNG